MPRVIVLIIFVLKQLVPRCQTAVSWSYHEGSCYTITTDRQYFDDVSAECVALGGHMAELETSEEFSFARNLIQDYGGSHDKFWVGLKGSAPTYRWPISGQIVNADFWRSGEPDEGYPSCVRFRFDDGMYKLADTQCDKTYVGICEKSAHLAMSGMGVATHNKYMRTQPPVTWPLCRGDVASRRSRVQCATWCSYDVTCVGFEFYDVTCQLVTLGSPCPVTSYTVTSGRGYFHNVDVDVDGMMTSC